MFGSLQLLSHELDLDAPWVAEQKFELATDEELESSDSLLWQEPDWRTCLAWFAPLVKQSLDSGATVLHLLRDRKEKCLRQLMYVPSTEQRDGYEWAEFVPMLWPLSNAAFRSVRRIASIVLWSKRGTIYYRYGGKRAKARYVQESTDDLVIYFTADRPAIRRLPPEPSRAD